MDWYEKEEMYLEKELAEGSITEAEFKKEIKDLQYEYEEARQEAANAAYNNY